MNQIHDYQRDLISARHSLPGCSASKRIVDWLFNRELIDDRAAQLGEPRVCPR